MASRILSLLAVSSLIACTGEQVQFADAGSADAGVETGACAPTLDNVVQNPSFEIMNGTILTGWSEPTGGSVTQRKGGAGHCDAWAEVVMPAANMSTPVYFGQDLVFDPPLPKGTKITATIMLKTLDAELTGNLEVGVVSSSYGSKELVLNADGTWKEYALEWTLPAEDDGATKLWVAFVSKALKERRVGVDRVTFVVTRP